MPGQCYSCGAQFGVLKKEHGCKNCGYSCCSKCLHDKRIPVPKRNNEKHSVCIKCFQILNGKAPENPPEEYDLPQAYLKRVAALKERESNEHHSKPSGVSESTKIPAHIRKLDKADRDIAMRLERLRESDKPKEKVTDKDLNARLANLRGENPALETKPTYQPIKRKPEVEQVDDLLDEICAEVEIDSHAPDPVKEIEARLAHLRHGGAQKPEEKADNNLNKNKTDRAETSKPYAKNIGQVTEEGKETDLDEINKLMEAVSNNLEMEARKAIAGIEKDKELMNRLEELKARNKAQDSDEQKDANSETENSAYGENSIEDSDEDEEAASKKILQRVLAEQQIDDKVNTDNTASSTSKPKRKKAKSLESEDAELKPSNLKPPTKSELVDSDYDDSDELPYCCICTEDAVLRCKDCNLDLYCQKCFRECHNEMGMLDHKTTPYKPPKGYR